MPGAAELVPIVWWAEEGRHEPEDRYDDDEDWRDEPDPQDEYSRFAVVGNVHENTLRPYLSENYVILDWRTDDSGRKEFFVAGNDSAGWTLDGYVIPRLLSGLITCREIDWTDW